MDKTITYELRVSSKTRRLGGLEYEELQDLAHEMLPGFKKKDIFMLVNFNGELVISKVYPDRQAVGEIRERLVINDLFVRTNGKLDEERTGILRETLSRKYGKAYDDKCFECDLKIKAYRDAKSTEKDM